MSIQFRVLFTPGRALAILRAQRFAAHVRKGQRRATHPAAKTAAHPVVPLAAAQPVAPAPCPSVLPSKAGRGKTQNTMLGETMIVNVYSSKIIDISKSEINVKNSYEL